MSWTGERRVQGTLLAQAEVEQMLQEAGAEYAVRRVPENAILFWEGEPHKMHYFLCDGLIEIYASDANGRKKVIDFYGPGSFFSFMILGDNNLAMTTARACCDSVVIAITKTAYFQALHHSPAFAEATVRHLFSLLAMQTDEVIKASFYPVVQRTAMLLLSLSEGGGSGSADPADAKPVLPFDNTRLADILGVSRNSVTSSLSHLQKQGAIEKLRSGIRVVDVAKLEQIARTERP